MLARTRVIPGQSSNLVLQLVNRKGDLLWFASAYCTNTRQQTIAAFTNNPFVHLQVERDVYLLQPVDMSEKRDLACNTQDLTLTTISFFLILEDGKPLLPISHYLATTASQALHHLNYVVQNNCTPTRSDVTVQTCLDIKLGAAESIDQFNVIQLLASRLLTISLTISLCK